MRMYREVFVLPFALQGLVAEPLCMAAVRHPPPVPQNLNPRRPSVPRLGGLFLSIMASHSQASRNSGGKSRCSSRLSALSSLAQPVGFSDMPGTTVVMGCLRAGVELQDGFLFAEPQRDLG